jgi:DNA-binding helix-hairpin-helix protein with protein kinase domain
MNSMDEATLREVQALPRMTTIAEVEAYWRPVQEARRLERVQECEANRTHVWQMNETACPHCDTPYVECLS